MLSCRSGPIDQRAPLSDADPYGGDAQAYFRRAVLLEAASRLTVPQRLEEWVGRVRERYQNVDWVKKSGSLHRRAVEQALLGREFSEQVHQGLLSVQTFQVV